MESVLSVRMDDEVKKLGVAAIRRCGYSPSDAVRKLFDYAIKYDDLPFDSPEKPNKEDIKKRIAAFDACHTKRSSGMTDDEIREARLRQRYGSHA